MVEQDLDVGVFETGPARETASALPAGVLKSLLECAQCSARQQAVQVVPGEGPADAWIAFVGQNPNDEEDRRGHPFLGEPGQVLDEWCGLLNVSRARALLTLGVKCHTTRNAKPAIKMTRACRPWLMQELVAYSNLKVVVPLGRPALEALLDTTWASLPSSLQSLVVAQATLPLVEGQSSPRTLEIVPLPHPMYALRSQRFKERLHRQYLPLLRQYLSTRWPGEFRRT